MSTEVGLSEGVDACGARAFLPPSASSSVCLSCREFVLWGRRRRFYTSRMRARAESSGTMVEGVAVHLFFLFFPSVVLPTCTCRCTDKPADARRETYDGTQTCQFVSMRALLDVRSDSQDCRGKMHVDYMHVQRCMATPCQRGEACGRDAASLMRLQARGPKCGHSLCVRRLRPRIDRAREIQTDRQIERDSFCTSKYVQDVQASVYLTLRGVVRFCFHFCSFGKHLF